MSENTNVQSASPVPGTGVAFVVSYALNHSVLWAILSYFLGWIYLLWVIVTRTKEIWPALVRLFT